MIAVTTVLLVYVAIAAAAFFFQRAMIFPTPAQAREPRVGLVRGDGFVATHLPGTPTIVHLHGNAEQLSDSDWLAETLALRGFGFYAIEYPGYGLAASTPVSEEAIYSTVEAALRALEQTVPRDQLILQGQSLGSGVAVEMARRGHGSKLMLISAYTSIPDVAASAFPFLPARLLVRDRFDSASKARDISVPVLLIHGGQDEIVPTRMSRTLATLFPKATLRIVEGAHHNDLVDRPEVIDALVNFARGE
ncbi:MAG: hypothetical protein H6Q89_2780 [Myxococcaceae bacterium]|nr:hypothetical protein [Myxococcaceae bacterium]